MVAGVNGWKAEVAMGGEVRRVDTGNLPNDGEHTDDSGDMAK